MSYQLTHERCAELLFAYAREELGVVDASQVRSHLETCAECRSELAGLKALLGPEAEGLTEAERVRLHHGILAAIKSPQETPAPVLSIDARRRQRWGLRAVQALGVAAALAVIAVGVGNLTSEGPQVNDQGAEGAGAGDEAVGGLSGPRPRFAHQGVAAPAASAENGSGARSSQKDRVALFAVKNLDLSRRNYIADLGRNPLLSRFANSYTPAEAEELGSAFIDALASGAGDARAEVAGCAESVTEANPGPTVPVFGSFTRFRGEDALVIAFIFTDEGGEKLDRYTIWVWRRGSCDTPAHTAFGVVR